MLDDHVSINTMVLQHQLQSGVGRALNLHTGGFIPRTLFGDAVVVVNLPTAVVYLLPWCMATCQLQVRRLEGDVSLGAVFWLDSISTVGSTERESGAVGAVQFWLGSLVSSGPLLWDVSEACGWAYTNCSSSESIVQCPNAHKRGSLRPMSGVERPPKVSELHMRLTSPLMRTRWPSSGDGGGGGGGASATVSAGLVQVEVAVAAVARR